MRTKIFICYSHKDEQYLDELCNHLIPLVSKQNLVLWDDKRISTDKDWQKKFLALINEAYVIILLISSDFIALDNILKFVLPTLLDVFRKEEVAVFPVIISGGLVKDKSFAKLKFINEPDKSISKLKHGEREAIWAQLADRVSFLSHNMQSDTPEIQRLIFAIKSRFPDISDEEVEGVYSMILDEVAKRIGAGDELAILQSNEESDEVEVTPFEIDKL